MLVWAVSQGAGSARIVSGSVAVSAAALRRSRRQRHGEVREVTREKAWRGRASSAPASASAASLSSETYICPAEQEEVRPRERQGRSQKQALVG